MNEEKVSEKEVVTESDKEDFTMENNSRPKTKYLKQPRCVFCGGLSNEVNDLMKQDLIELLVKLRTEKNKERARNAAINPLYVALSLLGWKEVADEHKKLVKYLSD